MNKLARGLTTAAIASALIIAPAAAANATYVPGTGNPTAPATVTAGQTITVTFPAGTFAPNESVRFVLTGENAENATLASTTSIVKDADAAGGLTVTVTLPSGAAGSYSLVGVGTESGATATSTFSVAAADSAAAPGGLANTGSDSAAAFWFAGGLLALGATTVVTLNVVRRNRAQA
jgi:hypothetical protein